MNDLTLTPDDMAFLRGILGDPEEITRWLVYADWLDEHDQSLRAEYLRQTVELAGCAEGHPMREVIEERLKELREQVDPNWAMMFDSSRIGNCRDQWRYMCPTRWDSLHATDTPDIRICFACREPVFYCHSVEEAEQFASAGQCVAISSRAFPPDRTPFEPEVVEIGLLAYDADEYQPLGLPVAPEARVPQRPWWKFW